MKGKFFMKTIIFILSLYMFLQTSIYGIYEIKQNKKKLVGAVIIIISTICLFAPTILLQFR